MAQNPSTGETGKKPGPEPRPKRFDERGIALQTIIIIVVLIAIAGGVAIALQQRAGDAIADLESADTSADIDTAGECAAHTINTISGTHSAATCVWTGTAANMVTRSQCLLVRGAWTAGTGGNGVCTITY